MAIDAFERLAASMRHEIEAVERGSIDHPIAAALGYVLFAIASPAEFTLMFRTERLDQANQRLRLAGQSAFGLAADAVGAFAGSSSPMTDPVLTRRVIGLWAQAHGIASLLLAGNSDRSRRARPWREPSCRTWCGRCSGCAPATPPPISTSSAAPARRNHSPGDRAGTPAGRNRPGRWLGGD